MIMSRRWRWLVLFLSMSILLSGCKWPASAPSPDGSPGLTPTSDASGNEGLTSVPYPDLATATPDFSYPGQATSIPTPTPNLSYPGPVTPVPTPSPDLSYPGSGASGAITPFPTPTIDISYPGSQTGLDDVQQDITQTASSLTATTSPTVSPTASTATDAYPGPGSGGDSTQVPTPTSQADNSVYPGSGTQLPFATPTATTSAGAFGSVTPTLSLSPMVAASPFPTATMGPTPTPTATQTPIPPPPWVQAQMVATDPETVKLASGKVQLVEFFAFWCGACQAMAPLISGLEERYEQRVNFIYRDIDDPRTLDLRKLFGL